MISISLCLIVKNEEKFLSRCLESASGIYDELIIVDTGSTDNTKQIAKKYTNKIYDFEWQNDFSLARNFCFSKATKDYIMWLDADDILTKNENEKLLNLKSTITDFDTLMLKYAIGFDNDVPTFYYYRERIVKNDGSFFWVDPVHEVLMPHGKILYYDIYIEHRPEKKKNTKRNLKIYENLLKNKMVLSPRQQFYYARELFYNKKFSKCEKILIKLLEDQKAWKENLIDACVVLAECYRIKQNYDKSFESLFKSFKFDIPRAKICCLIGDLFMQQNSYTKSIFWYNQALLAPKNASSGEFFESDYHDFYPLMQLSVCHYRIGEVVMAKRWTEKAAKIKPKNKNVKYNLNFFKNYPNNNDKSF